MSNVANVKLRRLSQSQNRPLNRGLDRHSTRMLGGVPRPRINHLADAVRIFREYLRCRKRLAKRDPEFFDYKNMYQRPVDAARQREWDLATAAAFDRIYGPTSHS